MFEKSVDFWAAKELELSKRRRALEFEAAAIEATLATTLLDEEDGGSTGTEFETLSKSAAKLRALSAALAGCRVRRLEAIRTARRAEVASMREQVANLEGELAQLDRETLQHLAALSELQKIEYPVGILNQDAGRGVFNLPHSAVLRTKIGELESRAAGIDASEIRRDGVVDIEKPADCDQITMAVLSYESDGPTAAAVFDWLEAVRRRAHERRVDIDKYEMTRARLVWRAGAIDEVESYLSFRSLVRPIKGATFGLVAGYDVAAGTFHSIRVEADHLGRLLPKFADGELEALDTAV